jgi:thiosulfate reductase cytochrome b subunit
MSASLPIPNGDAAPSPLTDPIAASGLLTRHSAWVRVTHWLATIAFLSLLLSGAEIALSHPRFYWGETGNVNMRPWLNLHLPSSRDTVPTGYGYVLPDANGWGRYLHFQAAWLFVGVGLLYVIWGLLHGHFRRNVCPEPADLAPKNLGASLLAHLRLQRPAPEEAWSYNVLQRITYLVVIFMLAPFMILSGLAMSPAFNSAVPQVVTLLGGQQTARSLHFLATIALTLFLLVHIFMIIFAGFLSRMRAMVSGKVAIEPCRLEE